MLVWDVNVWLTDWLTDCQDNQHKWKVKLSHYRPGQALRPPGEWDSQNSYTVCTWRWLGCQPYIPATFTSWEIFLVLISGRGWVDLRAIVQPEGLCLWKILIEPVTLRLVAQCLNQMGHCVPRISTNEEVKVGSRCREGAGAFKDEPMCLLLSRLRSCNSW